MANGGCSIIKIVWPIEPNDLKRSIDLKWLFDPVLHSSLDDLVMWKMWQRTAFLTLYLLPPCSFNAFHCPPCSWHWAIQRSTTSALTSRGLNWRCCIFIEKTSSFNITYCYLCVRCTSLYKSIVIFKLCQVIKAIPFDQLNIEVLSVEFNLLGK